MPADGTTNDRHEQIAALIAAGKTNQQIIDEVRCSSSSVTKVRRMLAQGEIVTTGVEPADSPAPPPKAGSLKARVEELEEALTIAKARLDEVTDHAVDLSIENVRLTRILRAQQEA